MSTTKNNTHVASRSTIGHCAGNGHDVVAQNILARDNQNRFWRNSIGFLVSVGATVDVLSVGLLID